MTLRIGLDGRMLSGNLTGVGKYVHRLCKELQLHMPDTHFYVYCRPGVNKPVIADNWHYRCDERWISRRLKPVAWTLFRIGSLAREDKLDIFWASCHFVPFGLRKSVSSINTIHDLVYKVCPSTMTIFQFLSHKIFFSNSIERSQLLLANSSGTAAKVEQTFKRRVAAVVRPGVDELWVKSDQAKMHKAREKYELSEQLILAVSTVEPRKNYRSLVNAFVQLKQQSYLKNYQLVIIGGKGWRCSEDVKLLRDAQTMGVKWLGWVNDADLQHLVSAAKVFVCPSIYEGFGMPAAEARAVGVQTLLSDIPELHEAGGIEAEYCGTTIEDLKEGLQRAVEKSSAAKEPEMIIRWREEAKTLAKAFNSINIYPQ